MCELAESGLGMMNALAEEFWTTSKGPTKPSRLRVWDSHWGFNVSEKLANKGDKSVLIETATKMAGMLILPASGIVLFLPGIASSSGGAAVQIAMLGAFGFVGFALHRYADKGFRKKVQIDGDRGEVRVGTLNAKGNFHERASYKVNDIESFFIVRSKTPSVPSRLKMRMKNGALTIPLLESSERTLVPILERIIVTLHPPKKTNRRMRTKTTGRFLRVSFD